MSANPLDPLGRGGAAHKPPPSASSNNAHHHQRQPKTDGAATAAGDHRQLFFVLHVLVLGFLIFLLVRVGLRSLFARIRNLWARLFAPSASYNQPLLHQSRQKYE